MLDIRGASLVSAIQVKQFHAYFDDPTYELSLLECPTLGQPCRGFEK